MKRVLLLIVCALVSPAQQALLIDIAGEWRQSADDRPEYSRPDLDDRSWKTVQLPWPSYPEGEVFWLRKQVQLPPWADLSRIVLTFGPVREVYVLYVNGVEAGSTGPFSGNDRAQIARPRSFPVPSEAIGPGRVLVIALRTRQPVGLGQGRSFRVSGGGPYRVTYPEHVGEDLPGHVIRAQRAAYAPQLVLAGLLLALSVLLALLWLADRERVEIFWLGVAVGSRGMREGLVFSLLAADSFPWNAHGGPYLANVITGAAIAELVCSSMGLRSRWLRLAIWPLWFAVYLWADLSRVAERALEMLALGLLLYGWRRKGAWRQPWDRQAQAAVLALLVVLRLNSASGGMGLWPVFAPVGDTLWSVQSCTMASLASILTMLMVRQLTSDRRERLRLAAEMEAARVVQQLLLPRASAASAAFEAEAVYSPAQEVGGDFYWTRATPDGALLVAVGDVSGKGLKAAMLVSLAIGILRNEKSSSPAAILGSLNEGLSGQTAGGFVSCCCARFDQEGVTIANAGHPSPYCDGAEISLSPGLPLGVAGGACYEAVLVPPGRFTFVSDGVIEAANAAGELFGFERTREISTLSAREIAGAAQAWGQNDDITVVTVRASGTGSSGGLAEAAVRLPGGGSAG